MVFNQKNKFVAPKFFSRAMTAVAMVAGAVVPVEYALSQEGSRSALEEIVVTATFRETSLQDTPLAITAVNSDMILERGYENIVDMASATPSVSFEKGTGYNPGALLYMRGVGQSSSLPIYEPGVGVLIDDVYFASTAGANLNFLDLDRVELLRGPQGTLTGGNAIGGAIKLYSAKPTDENGGYVEVGYGSNNTYLLRAANNQVLIEDKLFMRVSGGYKSDDGYVKTLDFACAKPELAGSLPRTANPSQGCLLHESGGSTTKSVRASLRWLPSETVEVNVSLDKDHTESIGSVVNLEEFTLSPNGPFGLTGFAHQIQDTYGIQLDQRYRSPPGEYVNYVSYTDSLYGRTTSPKSTAENTGFTGTVDIQLSDNISLKSITAWRENNVLGAGDPDLSPVPAGAGSQFYDTEQVSQEFRLNGSFADNKFDWTVGAFYYDLSTDLTGEVVSRDVVDFVNGGLNFFLDDSLESKTQAVYASGTWHVNDDLNFTAGVRYTEVDKDYRFGRLETFPNGMPGVVSSPPFFLNQLNAPIPTQTTESTDVRFAVDYRWTDSLMTYAQYSTGFKGGGINPTPFTLDDAQPFDKEELKAYEVGVKSDWFDGSLLINLAAYISKYSELQLTAADLVSNKILVLNAAEVTIEGLELEMDWRPLDGLTFIASAGLLDFQFDDLGQSNAPGVPNPPCIECINTGTPETTIYLSAKYEFELGDGGTLTPMIDAQYRDRIYGDLANLDINSAPSYWVSNARVTWKPSDKDWEVSLAIDNVFDEFYGTSREDAGLFLARPREMVLSVRSEF